MQTQARKSTARLLQQGDCHKLEAELDGGHDAIPVATGVGVARIEHVDRAEATVGAFERELTSTAGLVSLPGTLPCPAFIQGDVWQTLARNDRQMSVSVTNVKGDSFFAHI